MKEKFLKLSKVISKLQIRFLLVLLYIFIISPMSIIWRLISKDPLARKIDKGSSSYYINYKEGELELKEFTKPY